MTTKPNGTTATVNAALVHRQFAFLPGEICAAGGAFGREFDPDGSTGIPRTRRRGELPASSEEMAATHGTACSASGGNTGRDGAEVSKGHSSHHGVGAAKGRTMRHKEQPEALLTASMNPSGGDAAARAR